MVALVVNPATGRFQRNTESVLKTLTMSYPSFDSLNLSADELSIVNQAALHMGSDVVWDMLTRDPNVHRARIEKLAVLVRQSESHGIQTALSSISIPSGNSGDSKKIDVHHHKPLKVSLSNFDGKSGEKLLLWFDEMELGFEAMLLKEERLKVITALSHLRDAARDWARIAMRANPNVFPSWEDMKQHLEQTFLPPDLEHRNRSKFLNCKQGKRSLLTYIQELRTLAAGCISHPLPEEVKVTVFMQNLNKGPPRTQLFRVKPKTFDEAVNVAMTEELSLSAANGSYSSPATASYVEENEPEPMDIGQVEQARRFDKSNVVCHRCHEKGHYARECTAPAPQKNAHLNNFARSQRGRGRGRGRGRWNTPALSSAQGNGGSQ